jgi:hypothetical protein
MFRKHASERATQRQRLVRLAYFPPVSGTFLSEQTNHQQSVSSAFLSEQISTSHQPPAKQTRCLRAYLCSIIQRGPGHVPVAAAARVAAAAGAGG